jgi:hypothetical protein
MSTNDLPDKPEMHFKFFGITIAGKAIPALVGLAMILVFLAVMRIYGH